jgi:hypothetical protein
MVLSRRKGDAVRRWVGLALLGTLVTGLFAVEAPPVSASSCVSIYRIWYNSPGRDDGSNASLNGEWIQLHNGCRSAIQLRYWKIRDAARHTYQFGSFRIGAGKYVKVHTGRGTNTGTDRYWGLRWYVWNNDKDTAYLIRASGSVADSCSYNNPHASSVYC